jgi:hypothetical protein
MSSALAACFWVTAAIFGAAAINLFNSAPATLGVAAE